MFAPPRQGYDQLMNSRGGFEMLPPGAQMPMPVAESPVPVQPRSAEDHGYRPNGKIEAWSKSKQCWCPGVIEKVEGKMVTVNFRAPDGECFRKGIPLGHQQLRLAGQQGQQPQQGYAGQQQQGYPGGMPMQPQPGTGSVSLMMNRGQGTHPLDMQRVQPGQPPQYPQQPLQSQLTSDSPRGGPVVNRDPMSRSMVAKVSGGIAGQNAAMTQQRQESGPTRSQQGLRPGQGQRQVPVEIEQSRPNGRQVPVEVEAVSASLPALLPMERERVPSSHSGSSATQYEPARVAVQKREMPAEADTVGRVDCSPTDGGGSLMMAPQYPPTQQEVRFASAFDTRPIDQSAYVAPIPAVAAVAAVGGSGLQPGDRIEFNYNGDWLPGSLQSLDDGDMVTVVCDVDKAAGLATKGPLSLVRAEPVQDIVDVPAASIQILNFAPAQQQEVVEATETMGVVAMKLGDQVNVLLGEKWEPGELVSFYEGNAFVKLTMDGETFTVKASLDMIRTQDQVVVQIPG